MRFHIFLLAVVFSLGAAIGDRYGVPGFARPLLDRGLGFLEGLTPSGEETEAGADETRDAAAASGEFGHPANAGLTINNAGLDIIKKSEGLRLEAYQAGGQWLIGYGHSRTARAGMTITEAEALQLLLEDVAASENAVRKMALVPLNRNQFSAMVSLAYNLGSGGFSRSVVIERLNKRDYQGAAEGFLRYNRADGKVNDHLTERRQKERALFLA